MSNVDEVYVMLMMMRADENANIVEGCTAEELLACIAGDNYDECVASCGQEPEGPVKSGTLNISVSANNGAKAIIGGTSDLDTINFSASEAGISVDKIVLERYGYSSTNGVEVWLEDANGVKVTNEKTINSKDEIALTVKSSYRELDKTDSFVIVTRIAAGTTGGTIGFKVKEVSSSAETQKINNYTPTTYDMVEYNGSKADVAYKGSNTTYHYNAGESYDVARIKVTAGSSAITVNGFTLANNGVTALDLNRYLEDSNVKVSVDGTVLAANVNITKDNTLEISLKNGQKIDSKKNSIFVVSVSFDDLDVYGKTINLSVSDLKGIEEKTNTRVTFNTPTGTIPTYTFNGGEIKLTSTKLGTIDAAAGAERVVFAEGNIEINGQIINMANFTLTGSTTGIDSMEILLNGSVIGDATASGTTTPTFTFKGVTIDQSGKLQLAVTMDTEAVENTITVTPGSFNNALFTGAKYDESNQYVMANDVIGSITFSTIKVQSAKGSLDNNLSKSVEFLKDQTTKQVVFDGKYTAKKGDIYLNEFAVESASGIKNNDTVRFYLSINGKDVSSLTLNTNGATGDEMTFSNVLVKKGEEATVKLEAEVYAANTGDYTYDLTLKGEDSDGIAAGEATESTVKMSFVEQGGVTISTAATDAADTVLLRANNIKLAKFTVKPSKTEGTTLDSMSFTLTGHYTTGKVVVKVNGQEIDENISWASNTCTIAGLTETLDNDGATVEISYKGELARGNYELGLNKVNGTTVSKSFKKKVVDALVSITKQENLGDTTLFTFGVEKYDDTIDVTDLVLTGATAINIGNVSDGDTYEVENGSTAQFITAIGYTAGSSEVIDKTTYRDFFKVGSEYAKIFKAKD